MRQKITLALVAITFATGFVACEGGKVPPKFKKIWSKLDYRKWKKKVDRDTILVDDTANVFDNTDYNPAADTALALIENVETQLQKDSIAVIESGNKDSALLSIPAAQSADTQLIAQPEQPKKKVEEMDSAELIALKYNLEKSHIEKVKIDSPSNKPIKKRIEAKVWAKVSKKDQRLYLHIDGELVDTFKVSTGDRKHETPNFDTRPNGIMFKKYSSKKYPGGNYNGLGNMPYVVFIKGGYAIHGTTVGNIPKLGKKASHGCVRLHPNNAKIFFELVQNVGVENVWITISED